MNSHDHTPAPVAVVLHLVQSLCTVLLLLLALAGAMTWLTTGDRRAASANQTPDRRENERQASPIRHIAVSADEQFVDVVQWPSDWRRHDAHTGQELEQRTLVDREVLQPNLHVGERFCAAIRPPGELILLSDGGLLREGPLPGQQPGESIIGCSFSDQRNLLAAISEFGSLWLVEFSRDAPHWDRHFRLPSPLYHAELSPSGDRVALVTRHGELLLWDVTREQLVADWPNKTGCRSITWSGDGWRLLALGHDRGVRVWDARTGELVRQWEVETFPLGGARLSHDGRRAAIAEDRDIRIWDVDAGTEQALLSGHRGMVMCLQFANRDLALFSADIKGELRRWSLRDRREVWRTGNG